MAMTSGKKWGMVGGALLALIALALIPVFAVINTHNSAVRKEVNVEEAYSNISVVIQNRVDVLSTMINTVKESAEFEAGVLIQLAEARSQAQEGQVEQSNLTLAAVAEAYPEIQSVALYADVNRESANVENVLRGARESYNATVRDYRTFTSTIPNTWWLGLQGYEAKDYELFTANESAENFNPAEDNLWED